jgi:hypothetical protein
LPENHGFLEGKTIMGKVIQFSKPIVLPSIISLFVILAATQLAAGFFSPEKSNTIYLRANQIGYLPDDAKIAIAFSHRPVEKQQLEIIDAGTGKRVGGPAKLGANAGAWGNFACHYRLDFSAFNKTGRFKLRLAGTAFESLPFNIGPGAYNEHHELLLAYMRQQRCGYNPFLDQVCHQKDGRTMYGPMPDSTYIDASGGWHDAGDYLRYLLTSSNATARLLFSYRENRGKFRDDFDALGQTGSNGIPDILDEARWGLDWMLKMHPAPDQLFHQVADDRDHTGWDLPHEDTSDYGWGPGSYRVVYYATGKPQGLGQYQNTSTGIANLAGRYAAAMAMAAQIWNDDFGDKNFAACCLKAAKEAYAMGKKQPGAQEGTPCRQPYRYYESTWADDMEWGAAELFRATGEKNYLDDAKIFARQIGATSWMGADTARHYEFYPFANLGHYALHSVVDRAFQDTLAGYYRENLEKMQARADKNPYHIAVPFIWCSNNLVVNFITHGLLYEKMAGDSRYRQLVTEHRDWLLGRNPWGISAFVGIPSEGGNTPQFPHSVIFDKTKRQITGGLNDGPVYGSIFKSLRGIRLLRDDPYAEFQSDLVVYHDDLGDYSTNEPTMDGTADAVFFMAWWGRERE